MSNLFISSTQISSGQLDSNGSRLRLNFNNPIIVPKTKKMRILSTSLWYDMPNITAELGNTIEFIYDLDVYTFTINPGLYSLKDLQERISEIEHNEGLPKPFIELIADESTSLISFRVNSGALAFSMDYETNNYIFKNLLGFTGTHNIANNNKWEESTNKATLNQVNMIYVHVSFANGGYFNNSSGSNICAEILINVTPGTQILHTPYHPIVCNVNESQIDDCTIWLTSDGYKPIVTYEPWSLIIEFF